MKTAEQQLQRMEALCRKLAELYNSEPSRLCYELVPMPQEANSIVSEIPTPVVDEDTLVARDILSTAISYGAGINADNTRKKPSEFRLGYCDEHSLMRELTKALHQAREQGREEGRGGGDV